MPIYEYACPKCRRIFNFLSKRINPAHRPTCPKCGSKNLAKELSRFAMIKGAPEPASTTGPDSADADGPPMPDFDDPRVARVMDDLERDMGSIDENNPRHMAHMLRKMQQVLPEGAMPKEMETALRRLESGEDPDKIEADMGDVLGDWMGPGRGDPSKARGRSEGPYIHDSGLYDY